MNGQLDVRNEENFGPGKDIKLSPFKKQRITNINMKHWLKRQKLEFLGIIWAQNW
jgi:hypothetical protein